MLKRLRQALGAVVAADGDGGFQVRKFAKFGGGPTNLHALFYILIVLDHWHWTSHQLSAFPATYVTSRRAVTRHHEAGESNWHFILESFRFTIVA